MSNTDNRIAIELWKQIPRSLERQYGGVIFFMDEKREEIAEVRERLISVDISYTMRMASELTFTVLDEDLKMISNNYFNIGRVVAYLSETFGTIEKTTLPDVSERQLQLFEIANVGVAQGSGENPVVTVTCYSRAVQQMKRDRKPGTVGGSGTEFVKRAAKKYGLKFWGETTSKKQNINTASAGNKSESLWDVINSLAGEAKFVVYEVDGYLIFASEKFILKRWGTHEIPLTAAQIKSKDKKVKKQNKYIPLTWKNKKFDSTELREDLQLMEIPSISMTENNPWDASGTATIDRFNAVRLRPGMTIKLGGMSDYNGYYLIESVSFPDISAEPVSIGFKKPEKQAKDIKDLPIGARGPQVIDIDDQVGITARDRTYDVTRAGSVFFKKRTYKGIFPLPDAENTTNRYPLVTNGVFATGNIDLYGRPVLVVPGSDVKTTYSLTIAPYRESGTNGGKPFALLLTPIWTVGGVPVELTQLQTVAKYQSDGKFLAKVRGKSAKEAIANAEVYGKLISGQQQEIIIKKFPDGKYVNTPGTETYVIPPGTP
jgi:hypothetical protein